MRVSVLAVAILIALATSMSTSTLTVIAARMFGSSVLCSPSLSELTDSASSTSLYSGGSTAQTAVPAVASSMPEVREKVS